MSLFRIVFSIVQPVFSNIASAASAVKQTRSNGRPNWPQYLKRRVFRNTPGATLATILSIVSSLAFSFYVESFNTYNKVYGSIGTIIVIMLWMQLNCFILLVGFELNASIAVNKDLKEREKEEEG